MNKTGTWKLWNGFLTLYDELGDIIITVNKEEDSLLTVFEYIDDKEYLTYEIRGYKTQSDFDNCRFVMIDEGIIEKDTALKIGKACLEKYQIVKIQSMNLEIGDYIKILNR